MYAALVALAVALPGQQIDVSTIDGAMLSGSLLSFEQQSVALESQGERVTLPFDSLLEVRFAKSGVAGTPQANNLSVQLSDGSKLGCSQVILKDRTLVVQTLAAGPIEAPVTAARAICFRELDGAIAEKWNDLSTSQPERDLLIVRNGDVLDRLEGTVSALDEKTLTFLAGDTPVAIDRTKPKLFGVVFSHSPAKEVAALCDLKLKSGDHLSVASLKFDSDEIRAGLTSGASVSISTENIEAIDFGRSKIDYLSDIEPRETRHTPLIGTTDLDSVFIVRRDHSDAGPETPIRIDGKSYSRGLVIHSKTELDYRLNGNYRRFAAVAGIEQLVRPNGHVVLTISADGKNLFSSEVTGTQPPVPLDLDISGARVLTISVDFGEDWDIADHLALGDARLIK